MSNSDFHGPVNLGNPNEFTIHELALMVQDLIGSEVNIVQSELPADDPKIRRPDINLAKKELGWNPSIDLRSGLIETIKDFKSRISSGEN
jgi:UDP-glucuronate decarboxylase